MNEEPPRIVTTIDYQDSWDDVSARIRQAVLVSKAGGASRPRLLISVPVPPSVLLEPSQFHRLQALLDESLTDAVLLTSDPTLTKLAKDADIPTEQEPEWPVFTAPEPDYQESEPSTFLRRRRRGQDGEDSEEKGERLGRPRLFQTRPLTPPKEADEDHPA